MRTVVIGTYETVWAARSQPEAMAGPSSQPWAVTRKQMVESQELSVTFRTHRSLSRLSDTSAEREGIAPSDVSETDRHRAAG